MEFNELNAVLNDILKEIRYSKNQPCAYHKELEDKLNAALTETRVIKTEYSEAAKRLADCIQRLEKRLDDGDRKFDNIDAKIDDLQNDIHSIDKKLGEMESSSKAAKDTTARNMSIIAIIFAAIQVIIRFFHLKIGG